MRHVMVVTDETLVGAHLTRRVFELGKVEPLEVLLVVPSLNASDNNAIAKSLANLDAGLDAFRQAGIEARGKVGQPDPMAAIGQALKANPAVNLVILSTLGGGLSRWVNLDLAHRVRRRFDIAVEEVEGTPLDATPPVHVDSRPVKVLLVEDNEDDLELAKMALEGLETEVDVLVARTGANALEYIREASPKPDLILVDIKMPVMDGLTMLEEFESTLGLDSLNELNVVMVTSSSAESDRERAHALGAHSYVVKTPDFDTFQETLGSLVSEVIEHQTARL